MPLPAICRIVSVVAIATAAAIPAAPARADIRVQVLTTDPASPSVLGRWEHFWLRIGYTTDQRILLHAQPYFAGRRISAPTGGSPRVGPGGGEASFWFALVDAQKVDTVVVTAETERGTVLAETLISVDLTWTGAESATRRMPADWVQRQIEDDRRTAEARKNAPMSEIPDWATGAVFGFMAAVPLYFLLQFALLWYLRDGWRKAAAVPLALMAPVLAYTVFAFLDGSNLAPLVLILTSPLALFYLLGLIGLRRLST